MQKGRMSEEFQSVCKQGTCDTRALSQLRSDGIWKENLKMKPMNNLANE